MIGKIARMSAFAFIGSLSLLQTASASTPYDGSWNLTITTERGECDRNYHFQVEIANGIVSHPNLVKLTGHVSRGGAVRVSVSAAGKYAAGSGRLTRSSGGGRWTGRSGQDRCSGSWSAEKY